MRAGWWAGSHDVEGIRQLFIDAAARGDSLRSEFQPDVEKIAQYERKVLAQRYAALLHSIAASNNGDRARTGAELPSMQERKDSHAQDCCCHRAFSQFGAAHAWPARISDDAHLIRER